MKANAGDSSMNSVKSWTAMLLLTVSVACIGNQFVISDTTAGLFDDGAVYLIAAHVFSPVDTSTNDVHTNFFNDIRHLPPGLPLLLAMTGGHASFTYAHTLILLLLIGFIPVYFFYTRNMTRSSLVASLICTAFFLLPGTWIEALKIASENLYILLSCLVLLLINHRFPNHHAKIFCITLLISLCILTRTIGWSLVLALATWIFINRKSLHLNFSIIQFLLAIFATLPLLIWWLYSQSLNSSYGGTLSLILSAPDPVYAILEIGHNNIHAFMRAWTGITQLTTGSEMSWRGIVSWIFLLLSFIGYIKRIKEPDGLYLFYYLAILFIWPYPHDMQRFIYPLMPIFILYVHIGTDRLFSKHQNTMYPGILALTIFIAVALPGLHKIHERFTIGKSLEKYDLAHIPRLYTIEDQGTALLHAAESADLVNYLKTLGSKIPEGETLITLKPGLVTYLSGIRTKSLPQVNLNTDETTYMKQLHELEAGYILLTNIVFPSHPLGIRAHALLDSHTTIIDSAVSSVTGQTNILLLRINPATWIIKD